MLEIIQGKTTVPEASRVYDLPPSVVEAWGDDGKRGMENALRAKGLHRVRTSDSKGSVVDAVLEIR